jgi:hypothetical protein
MSFFDGNETNRYCYFLLLSTSSGNLCLSLEILLWDWIENLLGSAIGERNQKLLNHLQSGNASIIVILTILAFA